MTTFFPQQNRLTARGALSNDLETVSEMPALPLSVFRSSTQPCPCSVGGCLAVRCDDSLEDETVFHRPVLNKKIWI